VNRKHLLWHLFDYLGEEQIQFMISNWEVQKRSFSDNPLPGEISVSESFKERYEAYKKVR
jgi:hypothetical protein